MKPSTAFGVRGRLATSDASKIEKQDASKIEKQDASKIEKQDASTNDTVEHWIWRSFAWQRLRNFNVNANNSFKDFLRQPLGPPISLFGQSIQLLGRHAVVGVPSIIMLLFASYMGFFWRLIFLALIVGGSLA